MKRRDLLKYFGAGAIIAPVGIAGPLGRLIQPAEVDIIQPAIGLLPELDLSEVREVSLSLTLLDGSQKTLRGITFGAGQRNNLDKIRFDAMRITFLDTATSPVADLGSLGVYGVRMNG